MRVALRVRLVVLVAVLALGATSVQPALAGAAETHGCCGAGSCDVAAMADACCPVAPPHASPPPPSPVVLKPIADAGSDAPAVVVHGPERALLASMALAHELGQLFPTPTYLKHASFRI